MNEGFVCIKVDREERPDLDAVYMNATVALTGQGGWPMTCFLTPDGRPFYLRHVLPESGFPATAFSRHRNLAQPPRRGGGGVRPYRRASFARWLPACRPAGRRSRRRCATTPLPACCATRTPSRGGFGGAPKFPPSALLEALLRNYERTGSTSGTAGGRAHRQRDGARRHLRPTRPAASPDTASTMLGWYRISRRCCTTTRCCCGCTRTGPAATGDPLARRVAGADRAVPARRAG